MATRLAVLSLILVALAGCTARPTPPGGQDVDAGSWAFSGRLGVHGRNDSANLGIHWTQYGERFEIDLSGPLGLSVARIRGDGDSVTLDTADGETLTAPDADRLLIRALGYGLPVEPMRYWVRGMPAPGVPYSRTAGGLRQAGWTVSWREWEKGRPVHMTFEVPEARIRLIVREWQTNI